MSKNSRRKQRSLFKEICDDILGFDINPRKKHYVHNTTHKTKHTAALHKDSKETKVKRAAGFRPYSNSSHGSE